MSSWERDLRRGVTQRPPNQWIAERVSPRSDKNPTLAEKFIISINRARNFVARLSLLFPHCCHCLHISSLCSFICFRPPMVMASRNLSRNLLRPSLASVPARPLATRWISQRSPAKAAVAPSVSPYLVLCCVLIGRL